MAGAAAALLLAGGCGGGDPKTALPKKTTDSTLAPAVGTSAPSPQEEVRKVYISFWAASERATHIPSDELRPMLQQYSTGSYLTFQMRQINLARSKHQEPWGKVIRHIDKVEVTGGKATLHDCQDASGAGMADARTHTLIPGTRGPKKRNLVASFVMGADGQWRVNSLKQFREPC